MPSVPGICPAVIKTSAGLRCITINASEAELAVSTRSPTRSSSKTLQNKTRISGSLSTIKMW
jgi:hypothetical protein